MMMCNDGARGIYNCTHPPNLKTGSTLIRILPSSGLCSTLVFRLAPSITSLPTAVLDATTARLYASRVNIVRRRRRCVRMHTALVCPILGSLKQFGAQVGEEERMSADDSSAFDDQTSTFIIPSGGGFRVMFCPPGRSSNILSTMSAQLYELAATGSIRPQMLADTEKVTSVRMNSSASSLMGWLKPVMIMLALLSLFPLISSGLW